LHRPSKKFIEACSDFFSLSAEFLFKEVDISQFTKAPNRQIHENKTPKEAKIPKN